VKLELVLLAWSLRKMKRMKEKLGEAPSSKEEDEGEVVQLIGVGLQCPPVMLRRGGGASMVGERRELLHGLFRKRELERVRE